MHKRKLIKFVKNVFKIVYKNSVSNFFLFLCDKLSFTTVVSFVLLMDVLPEFYKLVKRIFKAKLIFSLCLVSCNQHIEVEYFDAFIHEPCMLVNFELDNRIEGKYFSVRSIIIQQDAKIHVDLPENFPINNSNCKNWHLGWGKELPFFDSGSENLRSIIKLDSLNGLVYLGELHRGKGYPKKGQRIVFWNKKPSGFYNFVKSPIIDTRLWPDFKGSQAHFGSVKFDSILKKWVIVFNEAGNTQRQIYAAVSDNLTDWEPANEGKAILKAAEFDNGFWAIRNNTENLEQTPYVSDIVRHNNKWCLFFYGYGSDLKMHIGVAVSEGTLLGPFQIISKPVLSPGSERSWDNKYCFYPMILKKNNKFIMFYNGLNKSGTERVGRATSEDLLAWDKSDSNPVISQNYGWRSHKGVSEPSFVKTRNDSIFLLVAGAKQFKMGFWHRYVTRRMFLDKSGNVDDTQLGLFLSTNGGKSFIAHKNNPVFINNYSNKYENEHLGANFSYIQTDTSEFIIYQAKSSYKGEKYNIMIREKKLNFRSSDY